MKTFVIRQNIARYTELLKRCAREDIRRCTLERLLGEERAKLGPRTASRVGEPQDASERLPARD